MGRFEQEPRPGSPQHHRRTFNLVPGRPQVDAEEKIVAEFDAGTPAAAHAVDDRRVESECIGAILSAPGVVLGESTPLPVFERPELRAGIAQMTFDLFQARESRADPHGGELQARERIPGHHGPDVVKNQAPDRRIAPGGEHHPDQASHRGSDPVDSRSLARSLEPAQERDALGWSGEPGKQRCRVRKILRKTVILLVLEPVALAAADDVHARDAATAVRETRRELVEVPAVARQAVYAYH